MNYVKQVVARGDGKFAVTSGGDAWEHTSETTALEEAGKLLMFFKHQLSEVAYGLIALNELLETHALNVGDMREEVILGISGICRALASRAEDYHEYDSYHRLTKMVEVSKEQTTAKSQA